MMEDQLTTTWIAVEPGRPKNSAANNQQKREVKSAISKAQHAARRARLRENPESQDVAKSETSSTKQRQSTLHRNQCGSLTALTQCLTTMLCRPPQTKRRYGHAFSATLTCTPSLYSWYPRMSTYSVSTAAPVQISPLHFCSEAKRCDASRRYLDPRDWHTSEMEVQSSRCA
jgi:hypothetical protein